MMTAPKTIRVMIVDDHTVVRGGLSTFLLTCDDMELVGEAASGEQALELCAQVEPDVVLMDLVMTGMDGATATRRLREKHPHVQVIVLTSFKEQDLVQGALQAGAIGYLLKDISAAELASAIRAAYAGKPTLAPEAAQALIQSALHPFDTLGKDLTEREREVLALMADGLSNIDISQRLVISISTTKSHVSNVLSKLHVSTRTEAVSLALKKRLVSNNS
jgi:two-component system, NarL family, response regulator LiaR